EYAYMVPNPLAQYADVYCGAFAATGKQRLGIVADASPAISGILSTLEPKLEECIDIVGTQTAAVDAADLTSGVSRLLAAEPDVVLGASVGGSFELLRSEEHTSELQSRFDLVCRLLLEKKNKMK